MTYLLLISSIGDRAEKWSPPVALYFKDFDFLTFKLDLLLGAGQHLKPFPLSPTATRYFPPTEHRILERRA